LRENPVLWQKRLSNNCADRLAHTAMRLNNQ
jgi:hypothetical protein